MCHKHNLAVHSYCVVMISTPAPLAGNILPPRVPGCCRPGQVSRRQAKYQRVPKLIILYIA